MKRGMEPFLVLNRTISSKSVGVAMPMLKCVDLWLLGCSGWLLGIVTSPTVFFPYYLIMSQV